MPHFYCLSLHLGPSRVKVDRSNHRTPAGHRRSITAFSRRPSTDRPSYLILGHATRLQLTPRLPGEFNVTQGKPAGPTWFARIDATAIPSPDSDSLGLRFGCWVLVFALTAEFVSIPTAFPIPSSDALGHAVVVSLRSVCHVS